MRKMCVYPTSLEVYLSGAKKHFTSRSESTRDLVMPQGNPCSSSLDTIHDDELYQDYGPHEEGTGIVSCRATRSPSRGGGNQRGATPSRSRVASTSPSRVATLSPSRGATPSPSRGGGNQSGATPSQSRVASPSPSPVATLSASRGATPSPSRGATCSPSRGARPRGATLSPRRGATPRPSQGSQVERPYQTSSRHGNNGALKTGMKVYTLKKNPQRHLDNDSDSYTRFQHTRAGVANTKKSVTLTQPEFPTHLNQRCDQNEKEVGQRTRKELHMLSSGEGHLTSRSGKENHMYSRGEGYFTSRNGRGRRQVFSEADHHRYGHFEEGMADKRRELHMLSPGEGHLTSRSGKEIHMCAPGEGYFTSRNGRGRHQVYSEADHHRYGHCDDEGMADKRRNLDISRGNTDAGTRVHNKQEQDTHLRRDYMFRHQGDEEPTRETMGGPRKAFRNGGDETDQKELDQPKREAHNFEVGEGDSEEQDEDLKWLEEYFREERRQASLQDYSKCRNWGYRSPCPSSQWGSPEETDSSFSSNSCPKTQEKSESGMEEKGSKGEGSECPLCVQEQIVTKTRRRRKEKGSRKIMVRVVVPQGEGEEAHQEDVNEEDLGIYEDDAGSDLTENEGTPNDTETEAKSTTTVATDIAVKEKVISVSIMDKEEEKDSPKPQEVAPEPKDKLPGILKKESSVVTMDQEAQTQSLVFSNDTVENDGGYNVSASDIYTTNSGLRGKANTPASMYTEWTELRDLDSRLANDSRDSIYKKAVNLMTTRCATSNRSTTTPLLCLTNPPFGAPFPRYFYIHQSKPTPMPPLKAWRGYNGNIYFEPIQVNQAKVENTPDVPLPKVKSDTLSRILASRHSHHSTRPNTTRSSKSASPRLQYRKMALLDKQSVIDRGNPQLQEDVEWIRGIESVGSLRVEQAKKKHVSFSKDRIVKGSVARSISAYRNGQPGMAVSGGRCSVPNKPSAMMRAQVQYTYSNQRLTTNTPEGSLPPLDELRLRLRHTDNKETVVHIIPPGERTKYEDSQIKPFIKYSPEVVSGQNSVRSNTT